MGSHAHNDIFSIELNVDGKDIIIDPGSFVYSSNETVRNQFRSVKSHNTIFWESIEPRKLNNGLFKMIDNGVREVEIIKSNDKGFKIVGNYSFNDRTHKRSINFDIKNKKDLVLLT